VDFTSNDSSYKSTSQANWMLGGTLSVIFGKWSNLVKQEETYKDPIGRWYTIQLEANNKQLIIITIYQISDRSGQGIKIVKAQLDKVGNETKTAYFHQKQMLTDLINYL